MVIVTCSADVRRSANTSKFLVDARVAGRCRKNAGGHEARLRFSFRRTTVIPANHCHSRESGNPIFSGTVAMIAVAYAQGDLEKPRQSWHDVVAPIL
ncbi:MAG: hypothetical protein V4724_40915, partial [Pseudomonadota bacterium]